MLRVEHPQVREINRRIEEIAGRRQRLWGNPRRLTNDRLLDLTRELNGHARDLEPNEPSRFMRALGLYAEKRRILAETERESWAS